MTGLAAVVHSCTRKIPSPGVRPNILWLVSEDNGTFLGCYGDAFANTPHLDRLAGEGILYKNAFCNAPVCAPSRSTIITGMYACSMGTQHMRSQNPIPRMIRFFTEYLKEAGYYCTNKAKEDYNTRKPEGAWDESSQQAAYGKRSPGQPFFSVMNFNSSHESSLHRSVETVHDPALVKLPPYHPDTPVLRHDWAQYYDRITLMDSQIGEALRALKDSGLDEDTIVFYYADNGGVLPRSKRFLYDSGTHVPLIIRFPKKFQHLAPHAPGTIADELVSFVDLAPTVLSLAGIPVPSHMQGQAFLGRKRDKSRRYVYAFRGRMDERYDMSRTVRNKRFRYTRNFMPHLPWGQHLNYLWIMPAMQSWQEEYDRGHLNEIQSRFFRSKPAEELYDTEKDPHEVYNLAEDKTYRDVLIRMRKALKDWMLEIRDTGFMPEAEMVSRSEGSTPFEMARQKTYDLGRIMSVAEMASQREPSRLPDLTAFLDDTDSMVRYWAMTGLLALEDKAAPAIEKCKLHLNDPSLDVAITAAEILFRRGHRELALPVLERAMNHKNPYVRLHAANVLDRMDGQALPLLGLMREKLGDTLEYVPRVMQKAIADLEGKK